jgi:hypothetical protein
MSTSPAFQVKWVSRPQSLIPELPYLGDFVVQLKRRIIGHVARARGQRIHLPLLFCEFRLVHHLVAEDIAGLLRTAVPEGFSARS